VLDRLDPVLPLSPGPAERCGFEGTLSLNGALDIKTGKAQGKTAKRHTSEEFMTFVSDLVNRAGCAKENLRENLRTAKRRRRKAHTHRVRVCRQPRCGDSQIIIRKQDFPSSLVAV
jgi:hypothetical protein